MITISITSDDIYNRLVAGEDKMTVGEDVAAKLNSLMDEAFDKYDKYLANQKAATEKRDAMKDIFKSISNYAKLNGDDSMDTDIDEMSDDEVKLLGTLLDAVFAASKPDTTPKTKAKAKKSDDKMIEDFLTSLFG